MRKTQATLLQRINGKNSENFFESSMNANRPVWPSWVKGVRKADKAQDKQGIDFLVETDIGELCVQVKSSHRDALSFVEYKKDEPFRACVIVIDQRETNRKLYERTIRVLWQQHENIRNGLPGKFLVSIWRHPQISSYF